MNVSSDVGPIKNNDTYCCSYIDVVPERPNADNIKSTTTDYFTCKYSTSELQTKSELFTIKTFTHNFIVNRSGRVIKLPNKLTL